MAVAGDAKATVAVAMVPAGPPHARALLAETRRGLKLPARRERDQKGNGLRVAVAMVAPSGVVTAISL
jgi:hypothetical protein